MNASDDLVDQALLRRAQQVLGTSNARDTLELALSLAIQRASRDQAVESELARFATRRYAGLARGHGDRP